MKTKTAKPIVQPVPAPVEYTCDCCERKLSTFGESCPTVGHRDGGMWATATPLLFGGYWCSTCAGQHKPSRITPSTPAAKPVFSAAVSANVAYRLNLWLTAMAPHYDRTAWDYNRADGWHPLADTLKSIGIIGNLSLSIDGDHGIQTEIKIRPPMAGDVAMVNGKLIAREKRTPEFLWDHFSKSLATLIRSLRPDDAKRIRAIFKNL